MNTQSTDKKIKFKQRLRLQRLALALATYAVVILATFIVTRFGLGAMKGPQWAMYIGIAVFGNAIFFALIFSGANLVFPDPSLTMEQILWSSLFSMVALYYLPEARPIVLLFYLPAFSFGMLRLTRKKYLLLVVCVMALYASVLGIEHFNGHREFKIRYELFLFTLDGILLTWFAFFGGFVSNIRRSLQLQKKEVEKAHDKIQLEMKIRKRAETEKDELIIDLKNALKKVKTLSGLLPICIHCKKVRDDSGYWTQIESYIYGHSEAEFSHSICQECAEKYYPGMDLNDD